MQKAIKNNLSGVFMFFVFIMYRLYKIGLGLFPYKPIAQGLFQKLETSFGFIDFSALYTKEYLPINRLQDLEYPVPIDHSFPTGTSYRRSGNCSSLCFALIHTYVLGM